MFIFYYLKLEILNLFYFISKNINKVNFHNNYFILDIMNFVVLLLRRNYIN